jgi:hypothetical protein
MRFMLEITSFVVEKTNERNKSLIWNYSNLYQKACEISWAQIVKTCVEVNWWVN